ncbi:DUF2071 domain-containing protein [Streptomyces griseoluteus]|uniref:DUF2071 domain-containing protein n=1 Tax=Streptomyces griseoluteus TaxID=29306 RepID=UPI0036C73C35
MVANRVPVLRARRLTQTFLSRPCAPATVRALPGTPAGPTELDGWPASRWRRYSRRLGPLRESPVGHEPWWPAAVSVEEPEQTVAKAAGPPAPRGRPVALFSRSVGPVRVGATRPVRTAYPSNPRQGGRT